MKLISINRKLIDAFSKADREVLTKAARPVVLIVRLTYRGRRRDFAVPLRSNIAPSSPKSEYFALPNRPNTRPFHHHGLHYIKAFPVAKQFYELYHTEGNIAAKLTLAFIDKYEKQIISECQAYLDNYCAGNRPPFSTDIDLLIAKLEEMITSSQ